MLGTNVIPVKRPDLYTHKRVYAITFAPGRDSRGDVLRFSTYFVFVYKLLTQLIVFLADSCDLAYRGGM